MRGTDLYSLSAGNRYPQPVPVEHLHHIDVLRIASVVGTNGFSVLHDGVTSIVQHHKTHGMNNQLTPED